MILRRFNGKAGRKKPRREFPLDRMLQETERVYYGSSRLIAIITRNDVDNGLECNVTLQGQTFTEG